MRVALVVLLLAACVKTNTVQCEDGRTCPSDFVCDDVHMECVHPDQLTSCVGRTDRTMCTVDAADDGLCDLSVCLKKKCGDDVRSDNELCDGPDLGSGNCTDFGFYRSKSPLCNDACNYDVTSCLDAGYCGDGTIDSPVEICEGAARPPTAECIDFGYGAGVLGCSACGPKFDRCERFGWRAITVPGTGLAGVSDVHGISATDLYAVGGKELFHFDGAAWTNVDLSGCGTFTTSFQRVWQAEAAVVFAANYDGSVIRVDHGTCTKWTALPGLQPTDLTGTSPTDVWVTTSQTNSVSHFDGSQWTQRMLPGGVTIAAIDIWAAGQDEVFAIVPGAAKLAHYQGSWSTPVAIAGLSNPHAVFGTSANDYFVGGANSGVATVMHWTGTSYVAVPGLAPFIAGTTTSSVAYGFTAGTRSFVTLTTLTGSNEVDYLLEYDGTSWTNLRVPVVFAPVWASPDGQVFTPLSLSNQLSWLSRNLRVDFPAFYSSIGAKLAAHSPSDAYLAAPSGLFHWNGLSWAQALPVSWDVTVAPTGEPYAVDPTATTGGLQYFTTSWQTETAVTGSYAISAAAANNVWTIEITNRKLWHWTGAGTGVAVTIPGSDFPSDVWATASPSTAVFVVESGSSVVREYNGSTWTTLPTVPHPAANGMAFVWGRSATDLYVGGVDALFHFNGSVWTSIPLPTDTGVTGVWGNSDNDLFIAAEEHGLLYWNGTELSPVVDGTPFIVNYIAGSGDAVFYTEHGKLAHELIRTGTWH